MRVNRCLIASAIAAIALAATAAAQEAAPSAPRILRVADFGGDGILSGEAVALQNLVTSYVMELKMFRVIDASGQELALKEVEIAVQLGASKDIAPLTADYVLSAKANKIGSVIVFTMDVTKVTSGEKKSVSDTFAAVNDLILAARRLTRSLFDKPQGVPSSAAAAPPATPAVPAASNQSPSLALLAGAWKGDKNVDRITLRTDGRGFAVLSSGVRMSVKATIEGATVVVIQDQPNSPDFYRPGLDLRSARIVAAAARPWRWVFALSADGASLEGVKESVFVNVSEKGAVSVDNGYVRDAVWKKLYR